MPPKYWLAVVLLLTVAVTLGSRHQAGLRQLSATQQLLPGLWGRFLAFPSHGPKQQQQQQQQQQRWRGQHHLSLLRWQQQRHVSNRRLKETMKPDAGLPDMFQKDWSQVFPQQWRDHNAALGAVRIGSSSLAELAAPLILQNVTLVNPAQLKRSITHLGNAYRLKRVLQDLRGGRPVKLAVIGGSISWGSAVERGAADWFSLVTQHLKAAFPTANVTGRNGCVPATPSSFMNMCLEQFMDEDVDLVFVEYAVNDGWDVGNLVKRKTYERLLRKVLNKPQKPAVIQVHLPTVGMAYSTQHKEKSHFHRTVEDVYGVFAAYYDLPSLSMRNAIWRLAEFHHFQMNYTHFYGSSYDFVHPLDAGHRVIADMVLFGLQQAFIDLLMHPWTTWDAQEVAAPLPEPMYTGNWEEVNRLCSNGKAFSSVVTESQGWQLLNEGDEYKPKWGYVSQEVGAKLVLHINTTRTTQVSTMSRMNVQLAYLRSYQNMGVALIRCGGGCECQDLLVNGHHNLRQSTIFLVRLAPTQAPNCSISVTIQSTTHSGNHKFKVAGVMVNEAHSHDLDAAEQHEELNQEKWLGSVLKGEGDIVERWSKAAKRQRQQHSSSSRVTPTPGPGVAGTDDNK